MQGVKAPWEEGGEEEAGQYGGTLHNSLVVLIYRFADLAPSQRVIAFVILVLDGEEGRKSAAGGD